MERVRSDANMTEYDDKRASVIGRWVARSLPKKEFHIPTLLKKLDEIPVTVHCGAEDRMVQKMDDCDMEGCPMCYAERRIEELEAELRQVSAKLELFSES